MRRALAAACLSCALLLHACAQRKEASPPGAAGEWLAQVEHAHVRADAALAQGDPERAHALLQAALERAVPAELAPEHLRVVRQDLWYRLSSLSAARAPQRALAEAERGLELGRSDDLFCSNLLVARGRALQALERDTDAASSYHEALAIDERLLHAALGRGQAGGP